MNRILIIANWKMNPNTLVEAKQLFGSVKRGIKGVKGKDAEVIICPPFVYLPILSGLSTNVRRKANYGELSVALGSQNCFWEGKGAFTGEISPVMLKDLGCKYVIIGHSERRKYFLETDATINKKLRLVLKQGLRPILCVDKISQIKKDIKGISLSKIKKIIVAYEPIWAIGTGRFCSYSVAKKFNLSIKKILGREHPTLYGGSVDSQNALGYIKESRFQGLLIGGVSLKPKEFVKIIKLTFKK